MTDIEATIARVLELDEKATPGPWKWEEPDSESRRGLLGIGCNKHFVHKGIGPLVSYYRTAAPELARECRKHIVERTYFVSKMCDLLGIPDSDNESGVYLAANKLRELHQRIIDAACLRDDVSDDDLVDAVRRLAAPSSGKAWNPVGTDPPPPVLRGRRKP